MADSNSTTPRLGIDIGATAVKAVLLDSVGSVSGWAYRRHHGHPIPVLAELAREEGWSEALPTALTGALAGPAAQLLGLPRLDPVACLRAAALNLSPGAPAVIDVGGGGLTLLELGEDGEFRGARGNSVCAAGTGSFLDEQAERLGMTEALLAEIPRIEEPPSIATRCSVFAKSDLIHRQQEGYGKAEVWSGLCRGLAQTILQTLLRGRRVEPGTLLVGGVARNSEVVRWLRSEAGAEIVLPEHPELAGALGAALRAEGPAEGGWSALSGPALESSSTARRPPLELRRSRYPSFRVAREWVDPSGTEVRISDWPGRGRTVRVAMGIDIGSTSTKAVLVDSEEQILLDVYRPTAGEPIEATRHLLRAIASVAEEQGTPLEILGAGTTGSGRKLVGTVTGADLILNEITAHMTGAMAVDPTIDTIFEIGGQDAKYIRTHGGRLRRSNMNYVCAAGTGSFVAEQARKLGFDVTEVGRVTAGIAPPITSDRCTVFMEQDVNRLLREGCSREEVMASVLYSVVQNYLTKVVGNRGYSREKVFFQGATARNQGLVAAFENLLGVEVVVSPHCHQMGAYGVALATLKRREGPSRFLGLAFADQEVQLRQESCELCTNRCAITFARVDGLAAEPSWGYLCGRDPEEQRVRRPPETRYLRTRERLERESRIKPGTDGPVIGLPRALTGVGLAPMWHRFLTELGARPRSSGRTDRALVEGSSEWVGADYCFPVKVAHGHVRRLLEDPEVEAVLLPHMVAAPNPDRKTVESYYCPYNIGIPGLIRSARHLAGQEQGRLLSPVVDLRQDTEQVARELHRCLEPLLGATPEAVERAWRSGLEAQEAYEQACQEAGREALREIQADGRTAVVILGRPYNVLDDGANLALPDKIARLGLPVLPMELLPLREVELPAGYESMYWAYGRRILEAARFVAGRADLAAVYLSNFSCGPDSFLATYVEEILGDRPLLMLELDEHGADAGYLTRLEAFADVLRAGGAPRAQRKELRHPPEDRRALAGRTLWVPPMHPFATPLVAAALRGSGIDGRALPETSAEAFDRGRALCRGSECVPAPATFGSFVQAVQSAGDDPARHALLMGTANGPCRFGQYRTLDRILLDRLGWTDTPIVSWNSEDSYAGTSRRTRRRLYQAVVAGDVLFKMGCRLRPHERLPGSVDEVLSRAMARLILRFEGRGDPTPEIRRLAAELAALPIHDQARPLVGIVGEIYVRCDPFSNGRVVDCIEAGGGEAWLAPATEWFLYTTLNEKRRYAGRPWFRRLAVRLKNRVMLREERRLTAAAGAVIADRQEPPIEATVAAGARYLPEEFEGESIITLGRAREFIQQGADLVVNCSPFGCMPGAITAGILQQMTEETGVPVLSLFYDGESGVNDQVATYLANLGRLPRRLREQPRFREPVGARE